MKDFVEFVRDSNGRVQVIKVADEALGLLEAINWTLRWILTAAADIDVTSKKRP